MDSIRGPGTTGAKLSMIHLFGTRILGPVSNNMNLSTQTPIDLNHLNIISIMLYIVQETTHVLYRYMIGLMSSETYIRQNMVLLNVYYLRALLSTYYPSFRNARYCLIKIGGH